MLGCGLFSGTYLLVETLGNERKSEKLMTFASTVGGLISRVFQPFPVVWLPVGSCLGIWTGFTSGAVQDAGPGLGTLKGEAR